jgi:putative tryptophan/tyrosine transport system substrate-binding protein
MRFTYASPVLMVLLFVFASVTTTHAGQRVARIGVLCVTTCTTANMNAFWEELNKLGWVEGANIVTDRKEAFARLDQVSALASELAQSKPDLIVAVSPQSARAAANATSEIPIVFALVADPVGMGLASNLAHPDRNITGAASFAPGDFNGKAFGIIRELLPQAKRLAAFINSTNEMHRLLFMKEAPSAAVKLGFQLDISDLRDPEELPGAVAAAKAQGADVLYVSPDAIFTGNRLPDLAAMAGLPSMSLEPRFAQLGGLISYGPDYPAVSRLGAHYVDRILRGAKPADLPIEQPDKYTLIINLKTARSLGVELPASLLARADDVIE